MTTDAQLYGSSGAKRHFRRAVYGFAETASVKVRRDLRVMYFDGVEGYETRFLLARGYRAENLHAVNRRTGQRAEMTKRLKRDGLALPQAYGCDIREIPQTALIASMDILHLDFMNCFGEELNQCLNFVARHATAGTVIAVNMLRGREHGEARRLVLDRWRGHEGGFVVRSGPPPFDHWGLAATSFQAVGRTDLARLSSTCLSISLDDSPQCRWHLRGLRFGIYRSTAGNQTMLWLSTMLARHESPIIPDWLDLQEACRMALHPLAPYCFMELVKRWMDGDAPAKVSATTWALGMMKRGVTRQHGRELLPVIQRNIKRGDLPRDAIYI
jgi:hypothetical protein